MRRAYVATLAFIITSLAVVSLVVVWRLRDISALCVAEQRDWHTWQRVIETTQHPKVLHVSDQQQRVLDQYANSLRLTVGREPSC